MDCIKRITKLSKLVSIKCSKFWNKIRNLKLGKTLNEERNYELTQLLDISPSTSKCSQKQLREAIQWILNNNKPH